MKSDALPIFVKFWFWYRSWVVFVFQCIFPWKILKISFISVRSELVSQSQTRFWTHNATFPKSPLTRRAAAVSGNKGTTLRWTICGVDDHWHKYKYTNTNTQIQIHKYTTKAPYWGEQFVVWMTIDRWAVCVKIIKTIYPAGRQLPCAQTLLSGWGRSGLSFWKNAPCSKTDLVLAEFIYFLSQALLPLV